MQNVSFAGTVDESEDAHPPGEPIARQLSAGLAARGWTVRELDSWRDAGWELPCERDGRLVQIVVSAQDDGWFAQIGPTRVPGLFGRLLGREPSATPQDTFAIAVAVHEILSAGGFAAFRWQWNGVPDADSLPTPAPPRS